MNKLYKSIFFKNDKLPFVESRYVVDSDYNYDEHFHETLSIGAIEEGRVEYIHQNDKFVLKPNELSIINPNIMHSCNPTEDEARTYHMIYLDTVWCKGLQEMIFENVDCYIPIDKVQIKDKVLFDKYIKLNYLLLDNSIFYLEKEEKLQEYFIELFTKYCKIKEKKVLHIKNKESKIEKAKLYIENNCLNNLIIKDISDYVELSEFHFIKLFKQQLHISPHKYLLNCKINRAKVLLSKGMNTIDVAYEVGFYDQSHFSKVFKRYVAATPNEYKNNVKA